MASIINYMKMIFSIAAWSQLVHSYVKTIRNGAVPCIGNAVDAMAQVENTKAINGALQIYKDVMDGVKLPTEDQGSIGEAFSTGEKRAIEYFKVHSIFDTEQEVLKQLLVSKTIIVSVSLWVFVWSENEYTSLTKTVLHLVKIVY